MSSGYVKDTKLSKEKVMEICYSISFIAIQGNDVAAHFTMLAEAEEVQTDFISAKEKEQKTFSFFSSSGRFCLDPAQFKACLLINLADDDGVAVFLLARSIRLDSEARQANLPRH